MIYDSILSNLDFDIINQIIILVPRIARLSLINCTLKDSEDKCFNNLITGI
jgi:hypothetical protein